MEIHGVSARNLDKKIEMWLFDHSFNNALTEEQLFPCLSPIFQSNLTLLLMNCSHISVKLQVGILDLDLCGPSIPKMLNLKGRSIHQCNEG